jgi:tRNA U55 pseudouridine synthase TruB
MNEYKFVLYNKEIGENFTDISNYFKIKYPFIKKICYSGRLDPMAKGILLLPLNDNCNKNDDYIKLDKIYNFKLILSSFKTDTYDILGINSFQENDLILNPKLIIDKVKNIIENYPKNIDQEYPPYSSIQVKINGIRKPLWKWIKYNEECEDLSKKIIIPVIKKNVQIYDLKINNIEIINNLDLLNIIKNRLNYLPLESNNFRQKEILEKWKESLINNNNSIIIFNITALVSTGTYIREICNNIGKILGIGGIALDIWRIKLGKYDLNDLKNNKYIFL